VLFYYTALDCAREAAAAELMMMARGAGASPVVGPGGGAGTGKGAGGGERNMAQMAQMASVYRRASLLLSALLLDCEASPQVRVELSSCRAVPVGACRVGVGACNAQNFLP